MATSAQVAQKAGVSRSTVSQILNGGADLFAEETVQRVRDAARQLNYQPSLAGRMLVRGTSDIVVTIIPDVTFNPRLREIVDLITARLSERRLTNLVRFAPVEAGGFAAILALKPRGVVSFAPLPADERARLVAQGVRIVDQPLDLQHRIDRAIGAAQARHLAERGYGALTVVLPTEAREQSFVSHRESGAVEAAQALGMEVLATSHIPLDQAAVTQTVLALPAHERIGVAAYNDEVALAVTTAAIGAGIRVPEDLGVVGIDNSPIARAVTPRLTTVDYDVALSGESIVSMLSGPQVDFSEAFSSFDVAQYPRVIPGQTT